jgi:predicted enzyme related to lactoylglutathione lyase
MRLSETSSSTAPASITRKPGSPIWIDAASPDVDASIRFYTGLFGWGANTDLGPDSGGYALLTLDGATVAGFGPLQEGQFPAWTVYFATPDADATAAKVEAAGGKVIAPAFDVLDSGRMAVFQDPSGAFFSVWQPNTMPGFDKAYEPNTFGWAELNTRGVDQLTEFYTKVLGWGVKKSEGGNGSPPYVEWQLDGKSIGGAIDLANIPGMGEVPPFWLVYFMVSDIDATAKKVGELGGVVQKGPEPYPGGRFAIVAEPSGAVFGLMEFSQQG